jgi:hypothetical protein
MTIDNPVAVIESLDSHVQIKLDNCTK